MSQENFLKHRTYLDRKRHRTNQLRSKTIKLWSDEERIKTRVEIARGEENKMCGGLFVATRGTESYNGENSVGSDR